MFHVYREYRVDGSNIEKQRFENFREEVREILKRKIYTEEQGWVADYVRIRVEAFKR